MNLGVCVQCGYCCTVAPCPFGIWDDVKKKCKLLTSSNQCSAYNEIVSKGTLAEISPAFGTGCSSRMFNDMRDRKIREIQRRKP